MLTGCTSGEIGINDLREAVSNQNYKDAKKYSKALVKVEAAKEEAQAISKYLQYEDNMLLAAFWEDDHEAVQYIAPIIHDINLDDPRFEAPVLVLAAAWGKTDIVLTLLEAGADPNYGSDKDGLTALLWACKSFDEQTVMVEALLKAGANIDVQSKYGETPYSMAEEYLNPNIIDLLDEYKGKTN